MDRLCNDEKPSSKRQYLAAIQMSLIAFCYGSAVGWLSPVIRVLSSPSSPLSSPLLPSDEALLASLPCLGAVLGTPLFGVLTDRFGRRTAGLCSAVPFVLCWLLKIFSSSLVPLLVGRTLSGVGGAGAWVVAPIYAVEVAGAKCRGALSSTPTLALNTGILFSFALGPYTDYHVFLCILLAVPLAYFLLLLGLPETPAYLVKKGRDQEAAEAIAWLRGVPVHIQAVQEELRRVKFDQVLAHESCQQNATTREILFFPVSLRALFVCLLLVAFQGLIGMFAIMSYASVIFEEAGGSNLSSVSPIIMAALQLLGSLISTVLVERTGRKILLASSAALVSFCMAVLGGYLWLRQLGLLPSSSWPPLLALSLAVMAFSIGVGPVPVVIITEVFMVQVRGIMITFIVMWMWVTSFLVSHLFFGTMSWLGIHGTFLLSSMVGILEVMFTLFCVPETKGKPLEETLGFFSKKFNHRQLQVLNSKKEEMI